MSTTIERIISHLQAGKRTRILAYGSSNTEHFLPGIHWVECVEIGLRERYGKIATTINTGICGDTSTGLLNRFEEDAAFYKPHVAFITIGGNDSSPDNNISAEKFEANLLELYKRFRDLGTEVIYQTYYAPMIQYNQPERYENFVKYSDIVRQVAKSTGAHLIDHLARWERLRDTYFDKYLPLMQDHFHPNARGNCLLGVDIARHFDAQLTTCNFDHWGEALYLQRLMDQLEKESE